MIGDNIKRIFGKSKSTVKRSIWKLKSASRSIFGRRKRSTSRNPGRSYSFTLGKDSDTKAGASRGPWAKRVI